MKAALTAMLVCLTSMSQAQQTPKNVKYTFTEASDLTLIGKLFPDTPNPYHRIDTVKYKGFTKSENQQVRESSGIAVSFKTNSSVISIKTNYAYLYYGINTGGFSARGYDLYIKKDGKWLWAAAGAAPLNKEQDYNYVILKNMDNTEKACSTCHSSARKTPYKSACRKAPPLPRAKHRSATASASSDQASHMERAHHVQE